jgi:hypothetical protein
VPPKGRLRTSQPERQSTGAIVWEVAVWRPQTEWLLPTSSEERLTDVAFPAQGRCGRDATVAASSGLGSSRHVRLVGRSSQSGIADSYAWISPAVARHCRRREHQRASTGSALARQGNEAAVRPNSLTRDARRLRASRRPPKLVSPAAPRVDLPRDRGDRGRCLRLLVCSDARRDGRALRSLRRQAPLAGDCGPPPPRGRDRVR